MLLPRQSHAGTGCPLLEVVLHKHAHSSDHPVLQSLILVQNLLSFEQLLLQLRSWPVDLSAWSTHGCTGKMLPQPAGGRKCFPRVC